MRLEVKTPLPPVIKKNEIGKHSKKLFNTTQNKKNEKKDINQQIPILKNTVPLRKSAKKDHFTIDAKLNQLIETDNNNKKTNNNNNKINNNNKNNKKNSNNNNNNKKDNKLSKSLNVSKSLSLFNFDNEENEEAEISFDKVVQREKNFQYHDIKEFLDYADLPELFNTFVKFKIYTKTQIENLTKRDLINMSINEKNRNTILERIEEIKNRPVSLEEFNGEFGTQCDNNIINNDPETFDIEENERIQSELFKKAVEEFRNAGKKKDDNNDENKIDINNNNNDINTDKSIKSITTNNTENSVINPKKFLFEIGGSDFLNLNNFSLFSDQGNDFKDDEEYLPELAIGRACWNCFKRLEKAYPINYEQKYFCSEKCLNCYKEKNMIKCNFCNKSFLKTNAVLKGNKKFCSIDCFKKDQNKIEEKDEEEDDDEDNNNNKKEIYKVPDFITNPKKNDQPFEMVDILDI